MSNLNLAPKVPLRHLITGRAPPATWHIDAQAETKYTRDVMQLHTKAAWWVFMYDNYTLEEEAERVAFTKENYLVYRQRASDGLVALAATDEDDQHVPRPSWADPVRKASVLAPATRVKGTIHLLTPGRIISIDKDVQNTVEFERRRISLLIPTRQMVIFPNRYRSQGRKIKSFWQLQVSELQAWIWEGKRELFDQRINGIDYEPADIISPASLWIGDFYTKDKCPR